MSSTFKTQLLLILAGVFIGTLIYFAPNRASEDELIVESENSTESNAGQDHEDHEGHNHEGHEHSGEENEFVLKPEDKELFDQLEKEIIILSDVDQILAKYDSLIALSKKKNIPPLVAKYTEKQAEFVPTEINWMLTGDNYFKAFRLTKGVSKFLVSKSIDSYNKVLELNPENLDAQTAIGVAYVEGASQLGVMPMKGIGIIKEVLNKDSKNVNALTNLGYFAIQSGQYEKAIERFETVLSIDPNNAEAYIYLTDVYLSQEDIENGIKTLEKYKSLVKDPLVKQQVDDYIKEIRNK